MAREDLHFRLRIPEDLKAQVLRAAEGNHRSMTAEIVARLQASFETSAHDDLLAAETKRADRLHMLLDAVEGTLEGIVRDAATRVLRAEQRGADAEAPPNPEEVEKIRKQLFDERVEEVKRKYQPEGPPTQGRKLDLD